MVQTVLTILGVLIFAPVAGGLLTGVDRRISARLQGRVGPPIVQPFYDLLKLMGKETLISGRAQIVFAWGYLLLNVTALIMLMLGQDLLVIVFVIGFAGVCLVAGGLASNSPYSAIGSQREVWQMLAYEPVLILFAVGVYLTTGSFNVSGIAAAQQPLLFTMPLMLVAVLIIVLIKLRKSPFDLSSSHHAHQELVRGVMSDYSGPTLGLIELAHWFELVMVLSLVGLFGASMPWLAVVLAAFTFIYAIVVDNVSARLTWSWMIRFVWASGIGLGGANLLLIGLGVGR